MMVPVRFHFTSVLLCMGLFCKLSNDASLGSRP